VDSHEFIWPGEVVGLMVHERACHLRVHLPDRLMDVCISGEEVFRLGDRVIIEGHLVVGTVRKTTTLYDEEDQ